MKVVKFLGTVPMLLMVKSCYILTNTYSATVLFQLTQFIQTVSELKLQLRSSLEQRDNSNEELNKRDQQIMTLKVELASIEERFKLKDEEVSVIVKCVFRSIGANSCCEIALNYLDSGNKAIWCNFGCGST